MRDNKTHDIEFQEKDRDILIIRVLTIFKLLNFH